MSKATALVEQEVSPATEANPMINVDGFKLKKLSVIATFSDTKKIDKAIEKFRKDALSVVPDLSTGKSRDAIASIAFKISKKKTSIVSQMIDPSIEDAKALVKNVNAGKAHFKTKMDELRDEVRKPLSDWEAEEKIREAKRIEGIKQKIQGIAAIVTFDPNNPPDKNEIASLLEAVDSISCEEGFDEFAQDALQAKAKTKEVLTEALNTIIQKEIKEAAEEELRIKELEIEKQRLKQQAQERVNKLMLIPVGLFGKTSAEIQKKINSLSAYEVPESEFGDLLETAKASVANVINQLNAMQQQQFIVEQAQAQAQQQKLIVEQQEQQQQQQQQKAVEQTVDQLLDVDSAPEINANLKTVQPEYIGFDLASGPGETVQQDVVIGPDSVKQNIQLAPEAKQGQTISKTDGGFTTKTPLTKHELMVKDVKFWANEYGIVNSEYSDLFRILNKYK